MIRKIMQLKNTALWIKQNSHALRVIGGFSFVLALFFGIIWVFGADVEPLAFIFGLISSLLFASPSIAEYILPGRKPVKEMTFDDILDFIKTTHPTKDWKKVSKVWSSDVFLKEDPRLRFRAKFIDDGIQRENFVAEWANKFPDKSATGYWHDLYFDGNLIDRFILVSVDGARASLPIPDLKTQKVNLLNYRVAQIHDDSHSLDTYLNETGLIVEKSD